MGFEMKKDFFEIIEYIKSNCYEIRKVKSDTYMLSFHDTFNNDMFYIWYSVTEKCFFKQRDLYINNPKTLSNVSKFNLNEFFNFCRVRFNDNLKLSISKEQRDYNKSVIDYIDKRIEYLI